MGEPENPLEACSTPVAPNVSLLLSLDKAVVPFWKCWRSKFESCNRPVTHVNGISDANTIAEQFVCHFSRALSYNTVRN